MIIIIGLFWSIKKQQENKTKKWTNKMQAEAKAYGVYPYHKPQFIIFKLFKHKTPTPLVKYVVFV